MTHEYPKPRVDSECLRLLKIYYRQVGSTGGNLHIWLDDGNIKDTHLQFCMQQAKDKADWLGNQLALYGLRMSKTQRKKVVKLWNLICYTKYESTNNN